MLTNLFNLIKRVVMLTVIINNFYNGFCEYMIGRVGLRRRTIAFEKGQRPVAAALVLDRTGYHGQRTSSRSEVPRGRLVICVSPEAYGYAGADVEERESDAAAADGASDHSWCSCWRIDLSRNICSQPDGRYHFQYEQPGLGQQMQ